MSAPDVFDELLSLKRLEVALKRHDDRMFEQGLERLHTEIAAKQPFRHHQAWQALLQAATDAERLSENLKERLREAIARVISVESRIGHATPEPSAAESADAADEARPIALVLGWQTALRAEGRKNEMLSWLARSGGQTAAAVAIAPGVTSVIERWIRDDGLNLEQLTNRANVTLAAANAGVAMADAPWVDTFMAGLSRVLGEPERPPVTKLKEAIAPLGPVSLVVAEPSLSWERFYGAASFRRGPDEARGGMALAKLAGSVDRFYCHACQAVAAVETGAGPQPLVVACAACGAPARPLVVPTNSPHFMPFALREEWAWGESLLREAGTWVLVSPPAPVGDAVERWLLAALSGDTRVVVLSEDDAILAAWRDRLAARTEGTVVTSHGAADEVLAFLLQGSVPEPKASEAAAAPVTAAFAKKKAKR